MKNTNECLDLRHGLGLLIVQQIIEAHHGKIQFDGKKGMGFSVMIIFEFDSEMTK